MRIIVYDTEFTTWDGAMARGWTGHTPDGTPEYREIIQIAALKIDWLSGDVVDTFDQLVKPTINPVLSDYCTRLTGLTQDDLATRGLPFPAALDAFLDFVGDDGPLCAYGNDIALIGENIALTRCDARRLYKGVNRGGISLDYYIAAFDPQTADINSGNLAKHFNLLDHMPVGAEHDALYDCHSIRVTLQHMQKQSGFLPFK